MPEQRGRQHHRERVGETLKEEIGVIIEGDKPGGDTSFIGGGIDDVLRTPQVDGAMETIARLVTLFDGQVWLVSKVGARMEQKTRLWLADRRFALRTGVAEHHFRFCRQRPEKADHARELGLTHFVDDRADVLEHLRGLVPHLFLFGPESAAAPEWTVPTPDWTAAERAIRATFTSE